MSLNIQQKNTSYAVTCPPTLFIDLICRDEADIGFLLSFDQHFLLLLLFCLFFAFCLIVLLQSDGMGKNVLPFVNLVQW